MTERDLRYKLKTLSEEARRALRLLHVLRDTIPALDPLPRKPIGCVIVALEYELEWLDRDLGLEAEQKAEGQKKLYEEIAYAMTVKQAA